MAARNLVIAVAFTATRGLLIGAVVPLGAVILGSVAVVAATVDWREQVELDLETPFSLRNALLFGALFLVVVVAGGLGEAAFGRAGLFLAMALSGLVSSAGATTSAVLLYRGGNVDAGTAVVAVLIATAASILVKVVLTATSPRTDLRPPGRPLQRRDPPRRRRRHRRHHALAVPGGVLSGRQHLVETWHRSAASSWTC
jgi:uncharacterized membrane protein (DUF4010 family)